MSYDYETYRLSLTDEAGFDQTFDYDAYCGPDGVALANEESPHRNWDPSARGPLDSGCSGYLNAECYVDADSRPAAQPWIGQVITSEPLQDAGFVGFQLHNTALDIGNTTDAAGRLSDPPMGLHPRHERVRAALQGTFHSLQSRPVHPSSFQTPCHDVPPASSRPPEQHPAHGHPYTTGHQLPRSDHSLHKDAHVRSISASSFNEINNSQWTVRQRLYRGNSGSSIPGPADNTQFPVMLVNVSAKDALDPQTLARVLEKPLEPAFGHSPDRKGKKWTCRYEFADSPPNTGVTQHHEYAARNQHSETVAVAKSLFGDSSRASALSVPLKRATVVEKVAHELCTFMGVLKADNKPLQFNGLDVDYNHLRIVNIFRPTVASMQLTLEILDEFRHMYSRTTRASYATF